MSDYDQMPEDVKHAIDAIASQIRGDQEMDEFEGTIDERIIDADERISEFWSQVIAERVATIW